MFPSSGRLYERGYKADSSPKPFRCGSVRPGRPGHGRSPTMLPSPGEGLGPRTVGACLPGRIGGEAERVQEIAGDLEEAEELDRLDPEVRPQAELRLLLSAANSAC